MAEARFLVDEDLPRSLFSALRDAGFDAVDVRDIGLRGKPDDRIFEAAMQQERVLVTGDLGFGNLLRYPLGSHAGIAVARLPNEMPVSAVVQRLTATLSDLKQEDLRGALVVIEPDRVRLRRPAGS